MNNIYENNPLLLFSQSKLILDKLLTNVALLDAEGKVIDLNAPFLSQLGQPLHAVIGQPYIDIRWWSDDVSTKEQLTNQLQRCKAGHFSKLNTSVKIKDTFTPVEILLSPIFDQQHRVTSILLSMVEMGQRKIIEDELSQREEQYRFVLEGSNMGFWDWDIEHNTVVRNARWAEILGYSHEEIIQTTQQWTDFVYAPDRDEAWNSIRKALSGESELHRMEYRMLHKNGSLRWILDQAKVMKRDSSGKPLRMCGTHTDITDRKQLEIQLEQQAHTDHLTNLQNRGYFLENAEAELTLAMQQKKEVSLLMVDVDHFKQVNDTYGHKAGDLVLTKIADLFIAFLRSKDIVGRVGGEEFSILLPNTGQQKAIHVAEQLRSLVDESSVQIEPGLTINITISVGVTTMLINSAMNIDMLLSQADQALYVAKRQGRNAVAFQ